MGRSPETGFEEIRARAELSSSTLPRTGLRDNLREGGLVDRLLLRITYGIAISRK